VGGGGIKIKTIQIIGTGRQFIDLTPRKEAKLIHIAWTRKEMLRGDHNLCSDIFTHPLGGGKDPPN